MLEDFTPQRVPAARSKVSCAVAVEEARHFLAKSPSPRGQMNKTPLACATSLAVHPLR